MPRICEICGRLENTEDEFDVYDICESCADEPRQPHEYDPMTDFLMNYPYIV